MSTDEKIIKRISKEVSKKIKFDKIDKVWKNPKVAKLVGETALFGCIILLFVAGVSVLLMNVATEILHEQKREMYRQIDINEALEKEKMISEEQSRDYWEMYTDERDLHYQILKTLPCQYLKGLLINDDYYWHVDKIQNILLAKCF